MCGTNTWSTLLGVSRCCICADIVVSWLDNCESLKIEEFILQPGTRGQVKIVYELKIQRSRIRLPLLAMGRCVEQCSDSTLRLSTQQWWAHEREREREGGKGGRHYKFVSLVICMAEFFWEACDGIQGILIGDSCTPPTCGMELLLLKTEMHHNKNYISR